MNDRYCTWRTESKPMTRTYAGVLRPALADLLEHLVRVVQPYMGSFHIIQ